MTTERQARIELAATYRLAARAGWDELVSTHISARVPGTTDILMNPFGLMFDEITASSLVRVTKDGIIVSDPTGMGYNPGGFITHSLLHRGRADAECVVHLHPQAAVAVSCLSTGLQPLTDEIAAIITDLSYHDYEDPSIHLSKPEGLLRSFADKSHLLQRNHGAFTLGESIPQAWLRMYSLARACEVQIMAGQSGDNATRVPLPSSEPEKVRKRREKVARVGALGWSALLRRLDREESDYKD